MHGEAGRDERLARDARGGILGEDGVEHGVRDRVGDLVGMAFGDGLGGEEVTIVHGSSPLGFGEEERGRRRHAAGPGRVEDGSR